MMITSFFRRTVAAAALVAVSAVPALSQSFTDTLIGAYRTSGLLEQNRALLRAADEDVAQAIAVFRPVIEYLGSISYNDNQFNDTTNAFAQIQASLLLYDFGRTRLGVDAAKETVLALREALRSVEQGVLLRAVSAHMEVLRQQAFVGLQQNNVRVLSEQLRASQDRFEVGEVTRTDVSIAESRLAAARSSQAAAQGALAQARAEYLAATGIAVTGLGPAPGSPALPGSVDDARAVAFDRHPDLGEARRNVTVAELGIAIAEAALRPTLSAGADVSVDNYGDTASGLDLTLRGTIYQGGSLTSAIREAQARRDASRAVLYVTGQSIEQGVTNAWADLAVAVSRVQATREGVTAADLALRGAREELEVGSRTTLDVLDLEQEFLDAQTDQVSAQIDRTIAVYAVLSSMGLLTADFLNLGIPTYDPAAYYNAVKNAPLGRVSPQGEKLDRVLRRLNQN